jgi:hypothetical protein
VAFFQSSHALILEDKYLCDLDILRIAPPARWHVHCRDAKTPVVAAPIQGCALLLVEHEKGPFYRHPLENMLVTAMVSMNGILTEKR